MLEEPLASQYRIASNLSRLCEWERWSQNKMMEDPWERWGGGLQNKMHLLTECLILSVHVPFSG